MKEKIIFIWKKLRKYVFVIVLAAILAGVIEAAFNYNEWKASRTGNQECTYSVEELGCIELTKSGNALVSTGKAGEIHLNPQGKYVGKLVYSYDHLNEGALMNVTITVTAKNEYGQDSATVISDNNPYIINQSVVYIGKYASEICISIPEGMEGVTIHDVSIKNVPEFHWLRWFFFFSLIFLAFLLWAGRKAFMGNVERLFLVFGLTAGTMLVLIMPLNKIGFDEETHFRNAYNIKLSANVSSTNAIEQLKGVTLSNWPYNVAQSTEERQAIVEYYEIQGDYTNSDVRIEVPTEINTVAAFDYIFMSLGIKLGKLLHLSFVKVFMMGRLFNMWSYILFIYFAIKRLPIGKYIMAAIALMPTPMFQAAVYSTDAIITGCVYLGISYLIAELIEKEKKLTVKNGLIMLGSLGFGILPKAVYFPLMALPFLIKKDRFKDKKQCIIFRMANLVCILGLLLSFVVSAWASPEILNDSRGGDVNSAAQMALILQHPFGFLKVLLQNVANVFWSYTFGEGVLGTLGHLLPSTCVAMIGLLMIFVVMTDNVDRSERDLTVKQKSAFALAMVLAAAFVWGSLYLAFNEVGATAIGGVQGRYFVPLLFILYLLLRRKKIKNSMSPIYYHYMVFGCVLFIQYKTFYDCVLATHCF